MQVFGSKIIGSFFEFFPECIYIMHITIKIQKNGYKDE